MDGFVGTQWTQSKRNVSVRAWSRPEVAQAALNGANFAAKVIDKFEEFLGINYSNPKMEFIVEPSHGSAEEDWGQITIHQMQFLIFDSEGDEMRWKAAATAAHELAHQWTGDLVTCGWWSD